MVMRRASAWLKAVSTYNILKNARAIGRSIEEHLRPTVNKFNDRESAKKGKAAFLQGVGCMWTCNLGFKSDIKDSILFHRLLPPLTMQPHLVASQLPVTGQLGAKRQ
jgi:hypothetical protein